MDLLPPARRAAALLVAAVLLAACTPAPSRAPTFDGLPAPSEPPDGAPSSGVLALLDQKDGDSFVASDGVEYRVGMIDTPEVGECLASAATAATASFLADGFTVEPYATDPHGRTVARVRTDAGDLGVHLARTGFATDRYLEQFAHEHPAYAAELTEAFELARAEQVGVWGEC